MSTVTLGILIVGGTVAVSLAVLPLARRVSRERLGHSQDVVAVMFAAVSVLYTVLLAFLVVLVWEQFNGAQESTEQEAVKISNLLRDANAFPPQERNKLQGRLITYTQSVIDDEWPTMAHGKSSPTTAKIYQHVWDGYYDYQPRTSEEQRFYDESITRLNDLGQARRLRVISSESSIPSIMWIMLVIGGVVTIAYLYLFAISDAVLQGVMIASVAGLLAFILFLILSLDHPFAGQVKVAPDAYSDILKSFHQGGYTRQH